MEDRDLLWVHLAKADIKRNLESGAGCRTRCYWMSAEGFLLDNVMVVGSPLLRNLARDLYEGKNSLVFDCEDAILPTHLIVEQLLRLFCNDKALTKNQVVSLCSLLRAKGIATLEDFLDEDGRWRAIESFCTATRRTRHGDNLGLVWILDQIRMLGQPNAEIRLQ